MNRSCNDLDQDPCEVQIEFSRIFGKILTGSLKESFEGL